ncbi:hypothetical protein HRS9139_04085 [Pyrenophora teres f. teres]|nr:hypothetical protein HRS9139_04085 [Pyrenophora teres f. teres]
MQVVGQCRKEGMSLGVQEVLRSRSIVQLATAVKEVESSSYDHQEYFDEEFDLSPIQSLYFKRPNTLGHFNQSFYLRVTRKTEAGEFHAAVEQLISRHSMLRARFSFSEVSGWQQRLTNDIAGSYRFRHSAVTSQAEIDALIEDSQQCFDHAVGPLFAADFFDIGTEQYAFLTGHHLVVDLVTWRLLLEELEEILKGGQLLAPALPFQKWAELQREHAETLELDEVLPAVDVPPMDFTYWGIQHQDNTYGNASHASFELGKELSSAFLTSCHTAYKTEPVEVLLASLIQSWSNVFTDRPVPAIFNEGHGREPWDSDIDITRTVGWFTALSPILVAPSDNATDTVRKIKDFKRRIPGNGRPYFARRCLTEEGRESFNTHWPMEILFNYLGQYQQLERADALLQPLGTMAGETGKAGGTSDFGHQTCRWGLFEISAFVFKGHLKVAFTFNRYMHHQPLIQKWISECQITISKMIQELTILDPKPTVSDFPLLSLDEASFYSMLGRFSAMGIRDVDVEDVYPCSSMQEGLLLSQTKDAGFYAAATLHEIKAPTGQLSWQEVADAWQQVVRRHPALRTLFIENLGAKGLYNQVVLKDVVANVVHIEASDEADAIRLIELQRSIGYNSGQCPNHRFTICTTADKRVFCSLDISHAIMDGHSMSLLASELKLACEGQLAIEATPYSKYIAWLIRQPQEASIEFWKSYLGGSEVCSFPVLDDGLGHTVQKELVTIRMDLASIGLPDLQAFCNTNGITLSNVFHTAWALTLGCYVGSKDVTFGYLTSARDSEEVRGVEEIVGPLINTLHVLELSGASLFNTALSYRRLPQEQPHDGEGFQILEVRPIYDPTEYPVSVNIEVGDDAAAVDLDYWTDHLTAAQARNVASTFVRALENIVFNAKRRISALDHLHGQRIELGEIEHHLKLNLPSGAKSAVELVKFNDSIGTKALVAFMCLSESEGPATIREMTEAVRAVAKQVEMALASALPVYYVPSMFMPVTSMPMTTSGKLDRKVLRALAAAVPESQLTPFRLAGKSGRAPTGQAETALARLWAVVLKLNADAVGAEDSFFRLGGDSISAMKLVTAARKDGLVLNVANVFAHPKLLDMAATASILSSDYVSSPEPDMVPFELLPNSSRQDIRALAASECAVFPDAIEDIYPCSKLQEGLIMLTNKDPGTYVVQPIYRLPAGIDLPRFKQAWKAVAAAEAALRTRIIYSEEHGFLQVVLREELQWQSLPAVEDINEATRQLPAKNGAPLTTFTLIGEDTATPFFVWTAHHAVYDGWSWTALFRKVEAHYRNEAGEIPATVPYARFIKYLSNLDQKQSDEFWLAQLDNITAAQFPQLPSPDHRVEANGQLLHRVQLTRNSSLEVTVPSMIRAAWGLLLATYSGSDDVLWGETNSGREASIPGIESIIGPTITTAPVRLRLNRSLTVHDYLKETQRQSSTSLPYQFAGLQHIRKLSSETAVACDFQSFLGIEAGDDFDAESPLWNMESANTIGTDFFSYAFVFNCKVDASGVHVEALFDDRVVERWLAQRIVQQFDFIMSQFNAAESISKTLDELDLLNAADRSLIDRTTTEKSQTRSQRLPQVPSDSPAYAFYTSGSTGKPKGAVINHHHWVTSSSAFSRGWKISKSSRVLQFASYTFDACLIEIFSTLMCGGTICVPDQASRTNDLVGVINKFNINWAALTPSVVRMMFPSQVPRLETLFLVGEAMSQQDLSTWADKVTLGNGYGPTDALASVATSGPCAKRLVAIISLQNMPVTTGHSGEQMQLLSHENASLNIASIRDSLCERLPAYMIPSLWVVIERFPLMPSGKMDRRRITQWVEQMDQATYRAISTMGLQTEQTSNASAAEQKIQAIFAKVLNLPADEIRLNQSFLHLGGDSIAAMQVSSQCRAQGLPVSVQEIIRSKSITALASTIDLSGDIRTAPEAIEYHLPFDLSPIQKVFFETVGDSHGHFNQTEIFRLTRNFEVDEIRAALTALVQTHPMLRGRFFKNEIGTWKQRIEKDAANSFRLRHHRIPSAHGPELQTIVDESQESLDVSNGPTFAIDVFDIDNTFSQAMAIVAHHLIIDVVSWGILLEDLQGLLNGVQPSPQSTPYHTWLQQQSIQSKQEIARNVMPLDELVPAKFDYWGMEGRPNLSGDLTEEDVQLTTRDTMLLLGAQDALATEILDILVAALLESFRTVFSDRPTITIHNEGHGRETFNARQDLSRTVGWFSTITPIPLLVPVGEPTDIVSTIQWVRDLRNRTPDKGRPYFAYRNLTEEGSTRFASHWPAEAIFNYVGRVQHQDRKDGLFAALSDVDSREVGLDVPRLALLDITAAISQGAIKLSFGWNRNMRRQSEIRAWVKQCRQTLIDAVDELLQVRQEQSLNSFKHLPLLYNGTSRLTEALPAGLRVEDIEDIYPASPMQQGLLITQSRNPELYTYHAISKVQSADGNAVDPRRLADAWQVVVYRHQALRTVFIDSLAKNGSKDQLVLKEKAGRVQLLAECDDGIVSSMLRGQSPIDCREAVPPHRLTICKTKADQVWIKLELSHAINDGTSVSNLLTDIARAYSRKLTRADAGPLYSNYIDYILTRSRDADLAYWKTYLAGIEPCFFPCLNDGKSSLREPGSVDIELGSTDDIQSFCKQNGVTLSNVLQLTWALTLHCYVGTFDVSFGLVASGRDIPVSNIDDAVGCFVNMLVSRLTFSDDTTIAQLLEALQTGSTDAMSHQTCSLADVQHELQLPALFNTAFTFQRRSLSNDPDEMALLYDNMEADDAGEYAVTVNADVTEDSISVDFGYSKDKLLPAQARNMADTFKKILNGIVTSIPSDMTVGKLDLFTEGSLEQIMDWNTQLPPPIRRCVHEVVHEQALTRPRTTKAVEGWDGSFTYQEFDKITDQLAAHLQALGVTTETFVPILFEKSSWAIVSMIAIMKAGGAYVPLDPKHPQSRLQELITDVGAAVVICSRQYHAKASEVAKTALIVDQRSFKKLAIPPTSKPQSTATPDNAAYCLFTSGTTGKPKGTIIPHQAFCTSAAAFTRRMNINATSRTFQFASYTFDASCIEILSALTVGATVCVPTEEDRMNNAAGAIRKLRVNWSLLTPSVLGTIEPERVPGLKTLVSGGEALPGPILKKWGNSTCFINDNVQSAVELVAPSNRTSAKALAVFFAVTQDPLASNGEVVQPVSADLPAADDLLLPMSDELRDMCKNTENGLAGSLPSYMIPSIFIPITKMPWTSAGKLDRNRLRTLVQNLSRETMAMYRLTSMANKKQPATEAEKKIHMAVCSVLNLPPSSVGIDDNFVRLGGDSISSMRLIEKARAEHLELSFIDVFKHPKLADLAKIGECAGKLSQPEKLIQPFELIRNPLVLKDVLGEAAQQCQIYLAGTSSIPQTPYSRFINYLTNTDAKASSRYWKDALGGSNATHFPHSNQTHSNGGPNGQTLQHVIKLSPHKHTDVTPSNVIRAAWALVLAAYTGSNDVVFGETLSGRDIAVTGIMDVCGPTLTTIPTRVQVDSGATVSELLKKISTSVTDRIPHQHYGISSIKAIGEDMAAACNFQNLLVVQTESEELTDSMWSVHDNGEPSNFFTYPLVIECKMGPSSMEVLAHFDANIISAWNVQQIVSQFHSALTQLQTVTYIRQVTVFSEHDAQLVRNWNGYEPITIADTVPSLFYKRVALQPNSVAIAAFDGELTYAELSKLASQMAQELIKLGAGPEQLIPICLDKSRWAIVAIMAVLISGAGYVPMSPADPVSRQLHVIEACKASIVLCSPSYAHRFVETVNHVFTVSEIAVRQLPPCSTPIQQPVVRVPKQGPCCKKLTAVVSFSGRTASNVKQQWPTILTDTETLLHINIARERLMDLVPPYMVPTIWIAVPEIPTLTSAKLDKKQVGLWLDSMDEAAFQQLLRSELEEEAQQPADMSVTILRNIWAKVLNCSIEEVKPNKSWLSLGGDSISAMKLIAKCRSEGINLTLNHVLRAKSLAHLAESIKPSMSLDVVKEQTDLPFALSPIQRLYFKTEGVEDNTHFNQSSTLRISRYMEPAIVKRAFDSIVETHSMLRARFFESNTGQWQQLVKPETDGSYAFKTHILPTTSAAVSIVSDTQKSFNIQEGPVFAVDLFDIQGEQILFLAAHHLVIDVVSWGILLGDLEELLVPGARTVLQKGLPFRNWCEMQTAHALEASQQEHVRKQPLVVQPLNLAYWGMHARPNVYGDVERDEFTINKNISSMVVDNHYILRTDMVDILLAAILHSFSRVFINRKAPTIFNESHGRETWESSRVDLSRTVGWFTTLYPVTVPISEEEDNVIHTLRQVKDTRRKIANNGRPYFAHRFLTEDGEQRFADHAPMEVLFNYLGRQTQSGQVDAPIQPMQLEGDDEDQTSDVGIKTARMALFEISASVSEGKIQLSFMYNRYSKNQKGIRRWIAECERTLEEIATELAEMDTVQPTMADLPLLPLESYSRLDRVVKTLPGVGIMAFDQVEEMYPCSPIQDGMILSQIKSPESYWSSTTFEVRSKRSSVDVGKIVEGWKQVVARHPALRTVFIDSVCKGGVFDQIVVKNPDSGIVSRTCDDSELPALLESIKYSSFNGKKRPNLPHQAAVIQTTSGKVVVKVIVNHAVIDGGSLGIIGNDLREAYEGRLSDQGPLYSEYIKYLRGLSSDEAIGYWKTKLQGVSPCYFPTTPRDPSKQRQLRSLDMRFTRFSELHTLAENNNVTFANILLTAWALVLRSYTNSSDVCYGYLTSGRNVPIDDIENAVGAFINMLVSRTDLAPSSSLLALIQNVQSDFIDSMPHQHCSLAQFQHDLGLSGKSLFNTAVSIQKRSSTEEPVLDDSGIEFEQLDGHDPSEFAITVNIDATRDDEGIRFTYWSDAVNDGEAKNVSALMAKILAETLNNAEQTVTELDTILMHRTKTAPSANLALPKPRPSILRSSSSMSSSSTSPPRTPRITFPDLAPASSLPVEAADLSSLIRSIVSEMVPQIVNQIVAQNKLPSETTTAAINQVTSQMAGMINRRTSQRGRQSIDGGSIRAGSTRAASIRSRRMSVASNAESRIQTAADMVATIGVLATETSSKVAPDFVEKKLLNLWSELLEMVEETIEQDDSFFQLGGDSIIAMRLVGAAREEGLSMTVADVFKNPTFADMARVVRVAGEVIDEVMSRAGGDSVAGISTTGGPSKTRIRERAPSIWSDIHSIVSEYNAEKGMTVSETPIEPEESKNDVKFKRWQGLTTNQPKPSDARNVNRRSQAPHTIPESVEISGYRSVSLLGDPNVDSVISKVQVFKGGISDIFPVTDFQALAITGTLMESKWMLNYFYLDGEGPLDLRKLKQAAYRMVQAFDILRTVFVPYGDRFLQVVLRKLQPEFIYHQTDDNLETFTTELRQKDRENGPRLGEAFIQFVVANQKQTGRHRIFMRLSHAQYDGVCMSKILGALQDGYNGLPVSSAPSFGNFVRETAKTIAGAHDHWREVLRGSKMTEIVNRFGPNYQRSAGRSITLEKKVFAPKLKGVNITNDNPTMQLGGIEYKVGAIGSQEDFADFSIHTTSHGGSHMEVTLTYAPNSTITAEFAQHVFDMLCANVVAFSEDPHALLPSPSEISSQSSTTINSEKIRKKSTEKMPVTLPMDSGLSSNEINSLALILRSAWEQILYDEHGTPTPVELSSDFFQLGGDIMGLAQVASILDQDGLKIRVEDLLDQSMFADQVSILAVARKKQIEKELQNPWGDKGKMKAEEKANNKKSGTFGSLAKRIGFKKRESLRT